MTIKSIDINKDTAKIREVVKLAFSSTPDSNLDDWFSFDEMTETIKRKGGICLKAINSEGKIIGLIHAQQENPINGREGKEKWVITNIAVIPEVTGQGIGGSLLSAIEAEAKKHGAKKMYVHTNKGDEQVIKFYKKYGYQDAGWIKDYYYAGSAIFFIKYLGAAI